MNIDSKIKPMHEGIPFVHHIRIIATMDDDDVEQEPENIGDEDWLRDIQSGKTNSDKLGISAIAIVYIPIGKESFKIQEICSTGLRNIDSDRETAYINQIKQEQLNELRTYLKLFHIDIPDDVKIIDEYQRVT